MQTNIRVDKLAVISDLHIGSNYFQKRDETARFLRWLSANDYDLCINGDGFEIAQSSWSKIAADVPDLLTQLKNFVKSGRRFFYVIGNHDIALEHFLSDLQGMNMSPFLNVLSGDKRIRLEHGHLYDPSFANNEVFYHYLTTFAGAILNIHPVFYDGYLTYRKIIDRNKDENNLRKEEQELVQAASDICMRGFDAVVFGHTHRSMDIPLNPQGRYLNTGTWLGKPRFLEINHGEIGFRDWQDDRKKNPTAIAA